MSNGEARLMRKKAPKSKINPAIAASMLYYRKEEFEVFFSFWDSINSETGMIEDGPFSIYIDYLKKIVDNISRRNKAELSKDYLVESLHNLNMLDPNMARRNQFEIWLNEVLEKDDEQSFLLPEQLFQCYVWNTFLEHVESLNNKDISYKEKMLSVDTNMFMVDISKEDGFFSLSEVSEEDLNKRRFKFYIDSLDSEIEPIASNFMVIAARPGVGKTTKMLNMALENASRGIKCIFISLEMSKEQLQKKVMNWYKGRPVDKSEWHSIMKEKEYLFLSEHFIGASDISSNPDVFLKKTAEKIKNDKEIGIVFLDYLQIARYPRLDEWESLRKLTRDCKIFAKDNDILMVSCSQVSRESTKYGIELSSLFGSSTIENDTDIIFALEEVLRDSIGKNGQLLKASILKNRMGKNRAEIKLLVDYATSRFSNYEK